MSRSGQLEIQMECVGRLMPSIFLMHTEDSHLRSGNHWTIGMMVLLPPSRSNPRITFSWGPWNLFLCSVRVRDHLLVWGLGASSALSLVPTSVQGSHSVKIQRCPRRILSTRQFIYTSISPRKKRRQQTLPRASVSEFSLSWVDRTLLFRNSPVYFIGTFFFFLK